MVGRGSRSGCRGEDKESPLLLVGLQMFGRCGSDAAGDGRGSQEAACDGVEDHSVACSGPGLDERRGGQIT
jgi:hypothetical protein